MFELNEGTHHDHLVCLTCGRVEEFVDSEIENRQHEVAQRAASACMAMRLPCTAIAPKPNCEFRRKE